MAATLVDAKTSRKPQDGEVCGLSTSARGVTVNAVRYPLESPALSWWNLHKGIKLAPASLNM